MSDGVPENITVRTTNDHLEIHVSWRDPIAYLYLVAILGFFLFSAVGLLIRPVRWGTSDEAGLYICMVFYVPAVVAYLYFAVAAKLLNRTVVELGPSEISIKHGPLPYPRRKNIKLPKSEVAGATIRKEASRLKGYYVDDRYEVWLSRLAGPAVLVISGIDSLDSAQYLCKKIEDGTHHAIGSAGPEV